MEVNVTITRPKRATQAKGATGREAASQRLKNAHNTNGESAHNTHEKSKHDTS